MAFTWTDVSAFVLDQLVSYQLMNELRGNWLAMASTFIGNHDLGGSESQGIRSASFTTIPESRYPKLQAVTGATAVATIRRKTDSTSTSIQVQVIDIDNANAVVAGPTSAYNADTTWQESDLAITLNAASHRYAIQVKGGDAVNSLYAMGRIVQNVP